MLFRSETMPNLLIGFGLMCTFIFLAIALQQAGIALNAIDASTRQQDQALQSLIATAGGKNPGALDEALNLARAALGRVSGS